MKYILTLFLLGTLTGCGGGGGGGGSTNTQSKVTYEVVTSLAQGIGLSTGFVPMDVDGNGITDLVIASPDKGTFTLSISDNEIRYRDLNFITGWMKDWVIYDANNDNKVDLVWNDHGQEQPTFELGYNGSLISNGNTHTYQQLPGIKKFYHGLGKFNNDVIVTYGQNTLAYYANTGNGTFTLTDFNLGVQFGPNAVGSVKMSTNEKLIVVSNATSQGTTENILFYKPDGTKVLAIDYPQNWKNLNMGAFEIVSGDFNNQGYDDIIMLGESMNNNVYSRSVIYLKQENGTFVDKTNEMVGNELANISVPDKLVAFDVNKDGKLDLIGFSHQHNVYSTGQGLFMNTNGRFVATPFGNSSLLNGMMEIPMFSTNADGSWKDLIGLYGVSTPTVDKVKVTVYKK